MAEELRILYEDPYLVVCVKPVGVLSEDSESGRSLPRMLAEHYRQAGKPDYIATVHRLDMRSPRSIWRCCGGIPGSRPPR